MTRKPVPDESKLEPVAPVATVAYFLGAGFSAASCPKYPVSIGFLVRKLGVTDSDGNVDEFDYQAGQPYLEGLLDRIERHYGPLQALNLEDVMTDLHIRAFGLGHAWEDAEPQPARTHSLPSLRRDYEALLRYITIRVRLLDQEPDKHALAQELFRSLKQQDSIITLNYDTIVERYLPEQDRVNALRLAVGPPGSTFGGEAEPVWTAYGRAKRGVLAKLHGSADWIRCPNPECPNHPYVSPLIDYQNGEVHRAGDLRCTTCASGTETVIIPPTAAKAFDRFPKLRLMWLQAFHALRAAQRWVFIGVSFAPADFHLSSLIRSTSRHASYIRDRSFGGQVCIVNKGPNAAKEARDRLLRSLAPQARDLHDSGEHPIALFSSLEEYLKASAATDDQRRDRLE